MDAVKPYLRYVVTTLCELVEFVEKGSSGPVFP